MQSHRYDQIQLLKIRPDNVYTKITEVLVITISILHYGLSFVSEKKYGISVVKVYSLAFDFNDLLESLLEQGGGIYMGLPSKTCLE